MPERMARPSDMNSGPRRVRPEPAKRAGSHGQTQVTFEVTSRTLQDTAQGQGQRQEEGQISEWPQTQSQVIKPKTTSEEAQVSQPEDNVGQEAQVT